MPYPPNVDPGIGVLYFNVHDEGATGDGSTFDAAAIQRCIDASVDDSVIFFPPGEYIADATIQIPGKRTLLGTNGSTIKMADGANLVAVLASQAWLEGEATSGDPIIITNLSVDGNSSSNLSGHGIVLMNFNSVIRECTVTDCYDNGIMLSSIGRSGGSISNTCVENRIESCKIAGCLGSGIRCHDTGGKLIDGYIADCIVSETTNAAISVDRGTGWFISRNYCYDSQGTCISVSNCFNTFITDNKVFNYGQNLVGSAFVSGIEASIIGTSPSVITGNIISTSEPNASYHYRHISVTFAGTTDTRCLVHGNVIQGGWDDNPNNPSDPSFSLALNFDANGTQTGSGQDAFLFASNNAYDNVGRNIAFNSYITAANLEQVGDVKLDKHLIASNAITGVPALAALTNNGTTPPSPTFSLIGGTDIRGSVKFGSGGSPSSGDQVSVAFAEAYSNAPMVVVTPQNAATAALGVYVSGGSTTGFNIATQNAPADSQSGSTYIVAFIVIG